MSYAIVGILVIAFIAFVILSAKAWHWSNIVFLCLCFLTGLGGLIGTAQVLDSRYNAMKEVAKWEKDLVQVQKQIETALYGSGFAAEYAPDSLRGLSEALNLELAGRGRVWRNGVVSADGDNRSFKFSVDRVLPEGGEDAVGMQDMLLFAFADQAFEDEAVYPVYYVGSFKVLSETAGALELAPVSIADQQEFDSPTSTWTLFEKAPVDQRDAYIRDTDIVIDIEDAQLNTKLAEYRKMLTEQFVPADSFGFDLSNNEQAKKYELMIDRLMFDGLPLVKIESFIETQTDRISQRFDPPNEEVFVRYRFDDKSRRSYQVDADGNIESDGQFTRNGQAVDPSLHAGGEIEFQKGDEILVDQLTADSYQRDGEVIPAFSTTEPVTEIERVFVRQLSDFPYLLKTAQRQVDEYSAEIARIDENNKRSYKAVDAAQNQSNERDDEIEKLLADQEKFDKDLVAITQYAEQTSARKSDVENQIVEMVAEIKKRHRKVKAVIRATLAKVEANSGASGQAAPAAEPITVPGFDDSLSPGELR